MDDPPEVDEREPEPIRDGLWTYIDHGAMVEILEAPEPALLTLDDVGPPAAEGPIAERRGPRLD